MRHFPVVATLSDQVVLLLEVAGQPRSFGAGCPQNFICQSANRKLAAILGEKWITKLQNRLEGQL